MSTMKDYMMWLDDRGIAEWNESLGELIIPSGTNAYHPKLVDEYKGDAEWHHTEPDDDEIIEDEEDEETDLLFDDDDFDEIAWSPDELWFKPDGGLTGEAYDFLYDADIQGELI